MRVAILAPVNSIHVVRWLNAFVQKVEEVHLITMHNERHLLDKNVKMHKLPYKAPIGYLINSFALKKIVRNINPDVFHVHQASGHGTLAAISGIRNYLLSVYGADIYDFPNKNIFTKKIIKFNLKRADYIASTSNIMALQTKKYTKKDIYVTPFGVDTEKFKKIEDLKLDNEEIIIGVIKTLKPKYGIKYLIEAFYILKGLMKKENLYKKLKLYIYGSGEELEVLKELTKHFQIENEVEFKGFVEHSKVAEKLNEIDIVCIPSINESFGVAAVEAMACERPIVVSDADGLKEVVNEECGFIVKRKNAKELAEKILLLIKKPDLAKQLGNNGRKRVIELYSWNDNVNHMVDIYKEIIGNRDEKK